MIKTYKNLRNHVLNSDEGIPKYIYRTGRYKLHELPSEIVKLYENLIINNPDYTLFYFDDADCEQLIKDTQDETIITAYHNLIPSAFKADLWRYVVLYVYGGIYLDFTMQPLCPLDEIVSEKKQIYVKDIADVYGMYNAFIATIPKSPLLKGVIYKVCYNVSNKIKGEIPLDVTGPSMLSSFFKNYFSITEIPSGNFLNDYYIYKNVENKFIADYNGKYIIKNKLENHYEIAYAVNNPMQLVGDLYRPLNHYSVLYDQGLIYADQKWKDITELYRKHLLRNPDFGGLSNYHKHGGSIEEIERSILNSEEYKSKHRG